MTEEGAPREIPWAVRIGEADGEALAALVEEHLESFHEREILLVLKHPFVTPEIVEKILRLRTLLRVRTVRRALAEHPSTPRAEALHVLEDLPWRDLAAVAREVRSPGPVRQAANRRLLAMLGLLSRGEKTALARLADRDLFLPLLEENDPMVLEALGQNPRLVPDDVVRWLTVGRPGAPALEALAAMTRWSARPGVREALIRHPRTPRGAALGLLVAATRAEWLRLAEDETLPPLLAAWVRRLLEFRTPFVDRGVKRVLT
ncbi:MAG: hypothetical protein ACHQPI_13500 [Thermoanaerobaculia bacterium]